MVSADDTTELWRPSFVFVYLFVFVRLVVCSIPLSTFCLLPNFNRTLPTPLHPIPQPFSATEEDFALFKSVANIALSFFLSLSLSPLPFPSLLLEPVLYGNGF